MESASSSVAGSGGGPAPFLIKTYEMVDDLSTDGIVSWSTDKNSFVVWNPPEFARLLLPTYFKHSNFSSFIRQLNTYGFRKIDPERWEFANEDFIKDKKHLLKNIYRRKPIHSHSHNNPQGSSVDPERVAFEEEIERLSREKARLEANILRFKQQRSAAKLQLEDLTQQVDNMDQRQDNLLSFLQKAVQNPNFVEHLGREVESMDISAYNKKRRKPQVDQSKPVVESSLLDNDSSCSKPESGNIFHQDFSNKLRLELLPAVSDVNLVSHSTQSSNEDGGTLQKISEQNPKDAYTRPEGNLYVPETFEVSGTGTSLTFKMDSSFSQKVLANDSPRVHSLQQRLTSPEEVDCHDSCHLNLTLSSSPLQVNKSFYSSTMPQPSNDPGKATELRYNSNDNNRNLGNEDVSLSSSQETPNNNPGPRVNDVFWEQFLTERPGSSDNEEASSSYRANPYEDQEDRSGERTSRSATNIQKY